MAHRVVTITEFKAKCLALLEDVDVRGGTITVTKRGRALATVRPAGRRPWKSLEGAWVGKVEILGDLLDDTSADWNVLHDQASPR